MGRTIAANCQARAKKSKIMELGAGAQLLRTYLHPSCTYYAADLFDRGPEHTIVFDLNSRPLPNLKHLELDVVVLAGVLEYVADVRSFVDWLFYQTKICIASYECASTRRTTLGRTVENIRRAGAGWVNTFTALELTDLFELKRVWRRERARVDLDRWSRTHFRISSRLAHINRVKPIADTGRALPGSSR